MAQHGLKEMLGDLTRAIVGVFIELGYIIIHLLITEFPVINSRPTCSTARHRDYTFVMQEVKQISTFISILN